MYNKYADYLKEKYGEKVYKLPVQLPVTCPNRIYGKGCTFCAEVGTGFEALRPTESVTTQLAVTRDHIAKRYKAKKYIAYFQNYTNTFLPLASFRQYLEEAALFPDVVELSISTRPDCISPEYLQVMQEVSTAYGVHITVELGLQTTNVHTLQKIQRGHSLAEYIDAMLMLQPYNFTVCTHVILNLPWDTVEDNIETAKILSALGTDLVKIHSLYIAKGTKMEEQYRNQEFTICSKEEYLDRLRHFLEHLSPDIVVERLFSRVPEEDSVFSNWSTSWWKLQDEWMTLMEQHKSRQGLHYDYLGGRGLRLLKREE